MVRRQIPDPCMSCFRVPTISVDGENSWTTLRRTTINEVTKNFSVKKPENGSSVSLTCSRVYTLLGPRGILSIFFPSRDGLSRTFLDPTHPHVTSRVSSFTNIYEDSRNLVFDFNNKSLIKIGRSPCLRFFVVEISKVLLKKGNVNCVTIFLYCVCKVKDFRRDEKILLVNYE